MTKNNNSIEPAQFSKNKIIEPAGFKPLSPDDLPKKKRVSKSSIFTGLVLLLCGSIAWFVFTASSVYIETEPTNASFDIRGGIKLKLADRYLIRAGKYHISLNYPGYHPLNQELSINDEQNQKYSYVLKRLPGHLNVQSTSAANAEIWLDDVLMGSTPMTVRDIEYGNHTLRLEADRYQAYSTTVDVEGLDKEQTLEASLIPAWGDVTLSSIPVDAEIYVDDELVGNTPFTAGILQGEHHIRVKLTGYKIWGDGIRVIANEALNLPEIVLQEADALVFLTTSPNKANVTVNGEYKGQTPLELALSPGNKVELRLFKKGYQRAIRSLAARSGDKKNLHITLQEELTTIIFNSVPDDAKLYIDGRLRGQAKQTLELSTKTHQIEIRKQGYVSYKTDVMPRIGVTQYVNVSLKTLRQTKIESIKPLIKTYAGQMLKLLYPHTFTMGASRRELGRRANETLRNVILTRPFYLALKEITNAEFQIYDSSHSSGDVRGITLNSKQQAVVSISWEQAALYCNWLSKKDSLPPFYIVNDRNVIGFDPTSIGYRLPTEAEWAWAARVVNKQQTLKFPWGAELPPTKNSGNYADKSAAHLIGRTITGYNDDYSITAPPGRFQANHHGLFDMGGNVSEWVHDYYDIAIGRSKSQETNPMGPQAGEHHVIRGSSWSHGTITELRLSYRNYDKEPSDDVGFRVARFLE